MAALRARLQGAPILLLEKTPRIGTKILISGGGKCNVAHDGPLEDVIKAFRPNEALFIRPACYRFTNQQVIEFFTSRGLDVYTRPDGRVFPVHQTAKDVVAILSRELASTGVELRLNTPVLGIEANNRGVVSVVTGSATIETRIVVLAVGGCSYPNSGTTGDGWPWAKQLGHSIVPVRAALAPITLADRETWGQYAGVALRDVVLRARQHGKAVAHWRSDVLFTHHGVSGPCALGISRVVAEQLEIGEVTLEVDLAPDSTFEHLGAMIGDFASRFPSRLLGTLLEDYLPQRLVEEFMRLAGALPGVRVSALDRKTRNRVVECLKALRLGSVREAVLEKGEVAAGGVSLDEVEPHSMRSKRCEGLFLCGEALDVAGPVGGYNLQAAFATGYVAGESAAEDWFKLNRIA